MLVCCMLMVTLLFNYPHNINGYTYGYFMFCTYSYVSINCFKYSKNTKGDNMRDIDIKSLLIGFLMCSCMILLMGNVN